MIEIPEFKFALRDDLKDSPEFLPTRAHETDTGYDVRVAGLLFDGSKITNSDYILEPYKYYLILLGFRVFIPNGWCLKLKPRSSTFIKKHLHPLYGEIDETFENEVCFACCWIPNYNPISYTIGCDMNFSLNSDSFITQPTMLQLKHGERIGQLIPAKRQDMNISSVSADEFEKLCKERAGKRGEGGFGSSGDK